MGFKLSAPLTRYRYVQNWMDEIIEKSLNTKKSYLYFLGRYCRFHRKNPDELIADRIQTVNSEDDVEKRVHEKMLKKFFVRMEEDGYKRNSAVLAFAAVRSFYSKNLGRAKELEVTTPRTYVSKQYRALTKKDIKDMCERSTLRGKAYILCQAQSGLGIGDLAVLRWDSKSPEYGTLKEQLRRGMRPLHIQILRGKEEELGYFNTFFGSNSCDALDEYSKTSWKTLFDSSIRTLQREIQSAAETLKLENVSTHSLRKFFNTSLKLNNISEDLVEHMLGHTLAGSRGHYLVPPIPALKEKYAKEMEPCLTIY